jgi:hypothetical protein
MPVVRCLAARLLPVLAGLLLAGCHSVGGGVVWEGGHPPPHATPMPPPHAPAWGRRARHHYYYYPDVEVYYEPVRRMYFYLSDDHWRMGVTLPAPLRGRLGDVYVEIDSDLDRPYLEHEKHRRHYPPGWFKKKGKHKDKHRKFPHAYPDDD